MSVAIKVEHVSKQYRLGLVGSGTMRDDMERWWYRMRGKEDPTLKLGETNDRSKVGESDYVWALRDINFEVQQGEVLGIIGKNGAGKSTLLKLLSRVTAPTIGHIKAKGRIASLLEVGTGFHPELTGKENIFLNGAIMGMKKHEIAGKLDEIVDFAGVERYLETPVKRYSSGMYVRLAFAVAAHLEPEILIVDEVLAVGDAEFQKKALGKMKDVSSGQGRTVLFVSHNMASVKSLCSRSILMVNGRIAEDGNTAMVLEKYLSVSSNTTSLRLADELLNLGNDKVTVLKAYAYAAGKDINLPIKTSDSVSILIEFENFMNDVDLDVTWNIYTDELSHVCHIGTRLSEQGTVSQGIYKVSFELPANLLNTKRYRCSVGFGVNQRICELYLEDLVVFDVEDAISRQGVSYHQYPGAIHPKVKWITTRIE